MLGSDGSLALASNPDQVLGTLPDEQRKQQEREMSDFRLQYAEELSKLQRQRLEWEQIKWDRVRLPAPEPGGSGATAGAASDDGEATAPTTGDESD